MNEVLKIDVPELENVEPSKADQIKAVFFPMSEMLKEHEEEYNEILSQAEEKINDDICRKARSLRLKISKIRTKTENTRKEQKEEYLRAGKAIDGVSNILKWAVIDKEKKLKEIEKHFEIMEAERLQAIQAERAEMLSEFCEDAGERDLASMDEDVWVAFLDIKKKAHFERIEAEKKAEAERIEKEKAEQEERERMRKENERLKKEAEERERLAKIEAEKRAKLEAELKAKEEAERKRREEEEAKKQAELKKGDKEKVSNLISDLETLKTKYSFKSKTSQKMYSDVKTLIDKIILHINK